MNSTPTPPARENDATSSTGLLADALQAIDRAEAGNRTGHVERGRRYATAAEAARHHAANGHRDQAAARWAVADTLVGPLDTADADQLRDFIAGAVNWDERRLHYILDQADIATRERHADEPGASTNSGDRNLSAAHGGPNLTDTDRNTTAMAYYYAGRYVGILKTVLSSPDPSRHIHKALDLILTQGPWTNPDLPQHLRQAARMGALAGEFAATREIDTLADPSPETDDNLTVDCASDQQDV